MIKRITTFFSVLREVLVAFFKAYDEDVITDAIGYPVLASWKDMPSPYESLLRGLEKPEPKGPPRAALVFVKGQRPGEVHYLWLGSYRLGSACDNDIVIHVPNPSVSRMTLNVTEEDVTVSTDGPSHPVLINGHVSQFEKLVDQDECRYNNAQFYFVALPVSKPQVAL